MASSMMTLLCLANARLDTGRRLVGRVLEDGRIGDWLRPISEPGEPGLNTDDRQYADGSEPRPLDILTLHMLRPSRPASFVEEHLTNPEYFCTRVDHATWDQALAAVDRSGRPLWSVDTSSASGRTDRFERRLMHLAQGSVRLIEVADLRIEAVPRDHTACPAGLGSWGRFTHEGVGYALPVADDRFCQHHLAEAQEVGAALVCVGLNKLQGPWIQKRIEAIIQP